MTIPDPALAGPLGVVGAGAMGAGIAQLAASVGVPVRLLDARAGAAEAAREAIAGRLARSVEKGRLDAADADAAVGRIQPVAELADLAACPVVIEAIIEDLDAKTDLFRRLEEVVAPDAILATNTSSLPIGAIAARLSGRDRIAGMHFFNPVPVMKLVEVIPGPDTTPTVLETLEALARHLGRTPVRVKDTPGFLVNLGGRAYYTEALTILHEQVATPAQIDAVLCDGLGFRMGPFALMDLTGMDVNYPVTRFLHDSHFADPRLRSTPLHRYMLDTGQLGRKTGRGHYDYAEGAAQPSPDTTAPPEAAAESVVLVDEAPALADLLRACGARVLGPDQDDGRAPLLAAPVGEDASALAARMGLDHRRLVACDMIAETSTRVTVMTPPGGDAAARDAVVALLARSRKVTAIQDSPGFIAQRMAAMIANLGCEMAQTGLAAPADIDLALRLGLNYPRGPLELADALGPKAVFAILTTLQALTGDDRYRPSGWLRRRAQLGLSALTP